MRLMQLLKPAHYLSEIFISVDVELNGPCPGLNSMLSIGAVACDRDGHWLSDFDMNLKTLPEAKPDPETMEWWKRFPEAYAHATANPQDPAVVMKAFVKWADDLPGANKTLLARPAGADWPHIYYYSHKFLGCSPFGFKCLDVQSYASAVLHKPYPESSKSNWPIEWTSKYQHSHKAMEDSYEQLDSFLKMRAAHFYGPKAAYSTFLKEARK